MRRLAKSDTKDSASKQERWDKILWLIANERIHTQNELSMRLEEEGFHVTQATISRDIRLLKLVKTAAQDGEYIYEVSRETEEISSPDSNIGIFQSAVFGVESARNLVVIRCMAGMAQGVCAIVDDMKMDSVLGSIAGDDTILIIARDDEAAKKAADTLTGMMR